jgi:hypothetical protein
MPQSGVAVPRGDDLYDEGREWHGLEWESPSAGDRRRPRRSSTVAAPVRASRGSRAAAAEVAGPARRTAPVRADRPHPAARDAAVVTRREPPRSAARGAVTPRDDWERPAFSDVAPSSAQGSPARRTVTIRGQGAERYVPGRSAESRRRSELRYQNPGFRPDRAAMWAVLLGIIMIVIAATSAHAATLHALTHLH